jgi:hypothetical protein
MLKKLVKALEVAPVRFSQHLFALSVKKYDLVAHTFAIEVQFSLEAGVLSLRSLRVIEPPQLYDFAFAAIIFAQENQLIQPLSTVVVSYYRVE